MFTLNCFVIKEMPAGESSKRIYVLTKEMGIISVFVRGGMKSSKYSSATQLYAYSVICAEEKRNAKGEKYYYLNSAESISMFYELRLDVYKASLAAYFTELLFYSRIEGNTDNNEVMRLTLNTFYYLNEGKKDRELLKSIFEFRLLCEIGFRPNLIGCSVCYKYEDDRMFFDPYSGDLKCESCNAEENSAADMVLDKNLLYIVRHISLTDLERLFAIRISPKYQKLLTDFTEGYVKFHYQCSFDTLAFYKSL
ncbi:DNA replication and repair protein RecO [Ruminococcaceae bacterium FB2012]|nr:DNA replication and repair protein RecO [Ruminococcaceae bacterium FB2012]